MYEEPKFNKKEYYHVKENVRNIEPGKRAFKFGEIVKVQRSDKSLDDGWKIVGFNTIQGGECAVLHKIGANGDTMDANGDTTEKRIGIDRLREWNK